MIFIFSNIKFGHPKLLHHQIDFFHDFNLMMFKTFSKPDDNEIFIRGDLFYNTKSTSFYVLNEMKKILFSLKQSARVYIVENNYLFPLFLEDMGNNYLDDEIESKVKDVSLFQLSKEDTNKIGYNIFKNNKVAFIENKISPRFIDYTINNIEDIDNIKINKDIIDLTINSTLLENQQYKNSIDIFLNNNKFNNVFYTEKIEEDNKVKLDSNNINIRNILIDNIEEDLKEELKEVFAIYDEKT